MSSLEARLRRALQAGARGVLLQTAEEDRALECLEAVSDALHWPAHTWSAVGGVDDTGPRALDSLFQELAASRDEGLWILLDAATSLRTPALQRGLRQLAQRESGPTVVLVEAPGPACAALRTIPELVQENLAPPSVAELSERIVWAARLLAGEDEGAAVLTDNADALATTALGLPRHALDRLLAEGWLEHGPDLPALRRFIATQKSAALDRDGMLELAEPAPEQEVGGLSNLKAWLRRRALALHPDAREAAIPPPRGVLLIGVQGCGKSLAARVSADLLGMPLVRLEPGRLFGGTVGESEANLRRTLAIVDRLAPVVLWLDEIDKGLAGTDSGASDGGTAARVVGGLLTWLQERTHPVFVAATANRIDALPPELLRRGRLDEIFFVDLPDAQQREAILRVHLEHAPLRRLGHIPSLADPWAAFAEVVRTAEGHSGAEIEAALTEARLDAFADRRPLAAADLRRALDTTVPLSRTRAESINALRQWAQPRARRA